MTCVMCGAETITALTPSGRAIELEVGHVWVTDDRWPTRLFILGVAGGRNGVSAVPHATPAIELADATPPRSGPFRQEHLCAMEV